MSILEDLYVDLDEVIESNPESLIYQIHKQKVCELIKNRFNTKSLDNFTRLFAEEDKPAAIKLIVNEICQCCDDEFSYKFQKMVAYIDRLIEQKNSYETMKIQAQRIKSYDYSSINNQLDEISSELKVYANKTLLFMYQYLIN